jgi:PUA-domain protein
MAALRHLKDRESKQIIKEFTSRFPLSADLLNSTKHLEELSVEDVSVFFADGKPWILRTKGILIPSLKFDAVITALPKIVVDMGAIPHIANGAPIMRPGIRQLEGHFSKGDLVAILDEKHRKTLALGVAGMDSETMQSMTKGRMIDNIHYVGDVAWNSMVKKVP